MPTIDDETRELLFQVLVMGGASPVFVDALELEKGELHTAVVQGWHPRFHFEAFPLDPWAGDGASGKALERLVPYVDALVLTDALATGTHYSAAAVERLGRTLGPGKLHVPSVVFGGRALAEEWQTLSNTAPVLAVESKPEQAYSAFKALAKVLLRSRMRSTPPPPPVSEQ